MNEKFVVTKQDINASKNKITKLNGQPSNFYLLTKGHSFVLKSLFYLLSYFMHKHKK